MTDHKYAVTRTVVYIAATKSNEPARPLSVGVHAAPASA